MRELYLKPTDPESIVRIPERGGMVMPAYGAKVIDSPFWRKRLRDESVVTISQKEFEQAEKKAKAAQEQTTKPATGTAGDK